MAATEQRDITLTTILHDPENRQLEAAQQYWPLLAQIYKDTCVVATPKVGIELIDFLRQSGAVVEQSSRGVGDGRRRALELALQQETEYIHLSDFDRILHWVKTYPQELPALTSGLLNHDFMILERTDRAFRTHPRVQQVAESITNKACSIASTFYADVTSGSCAMNREAAELIYKRSVSQVNDTDTEWPLLILENNLSVGHTQYEGLEFETPDFYTREIREAGGKDTWLNSVYNTPKMWAQRMELAEKSIEKVLEYESEKMESANRFEHAKQFADKAGQALLNMSIFERKTDTKEGNPINIVTEADRKVDRLIVGGISKSFPQDSIVSEERKTIERNGLFTWIVDPLDGTNSFSRGLPFYAVSIGLLKVGIPDCGVIFAPEFNLFAAAQLGHGATLNDEETVVSSTKDLLHSHLAVDYGYVGRVPSIEKTFGKLAQDCRYIFSLASTTMSIIYLLQGKLDGYINVNVPGVWDIAAATILIGEAGGTVTDIHGEPLDYTSTEPFSFVASNGVIHNELLEKLHN